MQTNVSVVNVAFGEVSLQQSTGEMWGKQTGLVWHGVFTVSESLRVAAHLQLQVLISNIWVLLDSVWME